MQIPHRRKIGGRGPTATAAALALPLALAGCLPKFGELEFAEQEPRRYVLPVLTSSVTVADALGENDFAGTLTVDAAGDYVLARAETVIDTALLEAVSLAPIAIPLEDSVTVLDFGAFEIEFPFSQIAFATAEVRLTLPNPSDEPVAVTFVAEDFRRGGGPLTVTTTIPGGGVLDSLVDFGGGRLVVGEDDRLTAAYDARLPDGRRVVLGPGAFALQRFTPSLVEGFITGLTLPLGRFAVPTDFLADFTPGQARVDEASISLAVTSGVTADAQATVTESFAVLRDGSRLDFATPFSAGVALTPAAPGATARTDFALDGDNSDLLTALLTFPDSVVFEIDATLNPGPPARAFRIEAADRVRLAYAAAVPLAVAFEDFVQVDTLALPALGELERITAATLRIVTGNDIPVGGTIEVYLLDGGGGRSADLLVGDAAVLRPAAYDPSRGAVVATRRDTIDVPVAAAALPLLVTAARAELRVSLDTDAASAGFVQLRPDQSLAFAVGLDVTVAREP